MRPSELLTELGRRGVVLTAEGESLNVDAPKGALTRELVDALSEHKLRLLRFLSPPSAPPTDGFCTVHRCYLTFSEARRQSCSWCEVEPIELEGWRGNRKARHGERGPDAA